MTHSTTLLFAYGTLMRGEPAHSLLADAAFLGRICTARGFGLVRLEGYPGMIESTGDVVHGELYELPDPARWHLLDEYEDCPNEYVRRWIPLATAVPHAGTYPRAQSYLVRDPGRAPRITSGDWRNR
ncbi:MAG: gamma-glutamylcyclotransferase family protein [Myxococcota bacterium]